MENYFPLIGLVFLQSRNAGSAPLQSGVAHQISRYATSNVKLLRGFLIFKKDIVN